MIRVGLIDGALPPDWPGVTARRRFCTIDGADLSRKHASAMATTIGAYCEDFEIINAVVFPGSLSTTLGMVCDALEWLGDDPPDIVLCSFGSARASVELSVMTSRLQNAGSLVVASAPARGNPVFPAAYPDVISVQGDARCGPGEISRLDLPQATYGACPQALGVPEIRGASAAAAHAAGLLAQSGTTSAPVSSGDLLQHVRYTGRERKSPELKLEPQPA